MKRTAARHTMTDMRSRSTSVELVKKTDAQLEAEPLVVKGSVGDKPEPMLQLNIQSELAFISQASSAAAHARLSTQGLLAMRRRPSGKGMRSPARAARVAAAGPTKVVPGSPYVVRRRALTLLKQRLSIPATTCP